MTSPSSSNRYAQWGGGLCRELGRSTDVGLVLSDFHVRVSQLGFEFMIPVLRAECIVGRDIADCADSDEFADLLPQVDPAESDEFFQALQDYFPVDYSAGQTRVRSKRSPSD